MDHLYYYGFFVTGYGFNGCAWLFWVVS
jgi:hypothetical protein